MSLMMRRLNLLLILLCTSSLFAQQENIASLVEKHAAATIKMRERIHQFPELGNREFETSKMAAAHLKKLGMEVTTGIAHTGVVGFLKGGKPGPLVAVRADMDALPVTEATNLPFKSEVRTNYLGKEIGV